MRKIDSKNPDIVDRDTQMANKICLNLMPFPLTTARWAMGFLILSLATPGVLVTLYFHLWIDKLVFLILVLSFTLSYCYFLMLGGIYFFSLKNPYLNEWKEKLGYHE